MSSDKKEEKKTEQKVVQLSEGRRDFLADRRDFVVTTSASPPPIEQPKPIGKEQKK